MRPPHWLPNRTASLLLAAFVGACLLLIWIYARRWNAASLPYHAPFSDGQTDGWEAMGGMWELDHDTVRNRSDEFGAKLLGGSPRWTDYTVDADVALIGHGGDVGLMVRSTHEEPGTDSFQGYYAGLRSSDNALVVGRADFGWVAARPVPIGNGVQFGVWYHLHVVAYQCFIGVETSVLGSQQKTWAAFHEPHCFSQGRIGLRSMGTGGAWRNITVQRATELDWRPIQAHTPAVDAPVFPLREADYARMRDEFFSSTFLASLLRRPPLGPEDNQPLAEESGHTIEIASLRRGFPAQTGSQVIRGIVTLTSPLYIQDSTGGIRVQHSIHRDLNLGDEIELQGVRQMDSFTPVFAASKIRLLADRTMVAPVAISSTLAASGSFDASLIELRGVLDSKEKLNDGTIVLYLHDAALPFSAQVRSGFLSQNDRTWIPGSTLLVRGICDVRGKTAGTRDAFTVVLRSADDAQQLAGPPWWTGRQLLRLLAICVVLLATLVYLYLHLMRWRDQLVIAERERLAHDLHDTLAQGFAGVGFHLQALRKAMATRRISFDHAEEELERACSMVSYTHREASASIGSLGTKAEVLQDFFAALERNTRQALFELDANRTEMPVQFATIGKSSPLSIPLRDAFYHVGREAISNMIRHSQATQMNVTLFYQPRRVQMEIRDNGIGFDPNAKTSGFGLQGMIARCERVPAVLEIESAPGSGTSIRLSASYSRLRLRAWLRALINPLRSR